MASYQIFHGTHGCGRQTTIAIRRRQRMPKVTRCRMPDVSWQGGTWLQNCSQAVTQDPIRSMVMLILGIALASVAQIGGQLSWEICAQLPAAIRMISCCAQLLQVRPAQRELRVVAKAMPIWFQKPWAYSDSTRHFWPCLCSTD